MKSFSFFFVALLVCSSSIAKPNIIMVTDPTMPTLTNISVCDDDNDGFEVFNLTVQNSVILASQSGAASDYQITYHEDATDAQVGGGGIANPSIYYNIQFSAQTIYVRIRNINTNEVAFGQFQILVNPKPYATGPQTFMTCDVDGNPYNGIMAINLTMFASSILNDQNSNQYTLTYYASLANADAGVGSIISASNYTATNGQSVWARVENNVTGCYALTTINIIIEPKPNPIITTVNNVNTICVDYMTGTVVRSLTLDSGVANPSAYTFNWYEDGALIVGVNGASYNVITSDLSGATRNYSVVVSSNSVLGCASSSSVPFSVIQSGHALPNVNTSGYHIINLSGVQSIVVTVSGFGTYEYSLDNGPRQASNVFNNVSLGEHTINVWDTEGGLDYSCNPLIINNVAIVTSQVSAPTGSNAQSFGTGATLADIVVSGSNIQWYALPYGNTSPLPLNTTLVNGTTYYATQNVGGIESSARLAVTVQVTLGMQENETLTLRYAPNPVKDILDLQSNSILKSVLVYNLLGQKVFEQFVDDNHVFIDLSNLHTGNYVLQAQGETSLKTIRIVKE